MTSPFSDFRRRLSSEQLSAHVGSNLAQSRWIRRVLGLRFRADRDLDYGVVRLIGRFPIADDSAWNPRHLPLATSCGRRWLSPMGASADRPPWRLPGWLRQQGVLDRSGWR